MTSPSPLLLAVIWTVVSAGVWAAGCADPGDGPDRAARDGAVRDTLPDGRVHVRHAALPALPAETLVADLRLGSLDDGPSAFSDVRGVEALDDGTILVLDHQSSEIRVFASDGSYLRSVAGRGDGPGELRAANGIQLGEEDVIWVKDHGRWSIVGLTPDGEEVARHPTVDRAYGWVWSGWRDDGGRFWLPRWHGDESAVMPSESRRVEATGATFLKWYDPAEESTDSVRIGERSLRSYIFVGDGRWRYLPLPFEPGAEAGAASGYWSSTTREYRILRFDLDGDTALVLEVEAEGAPVDGAAREAWLDERGRRFDPAQRARFREVFAELFPDRMPVVESLAVDERGRLWVRRHVPRGALPRYDVFETDGSFVSSVSTEERLAATFPVVVRGHHLYGLVTDDLDTPVVVRMTLPESLR